AGPRRRHRPARIRRLPDRREFLTVTTSDSVAFSGPPPGAGGDPSDTSRALTARLSPAHHVLRGAARITRASGPAIMSLVGLFLASRALEALWVAGSSFVTTQTWEPDSHRFGIAAVLTGTVLIALVAITIAVPLAVGTALYISEYAPARVKPTLTS